MLLSSIVTLLQSALLLLTLAQNTPTLPQSFRDNATIIAQQAINEATVALSSQSAVGNLTHAAPTAAPVTGNPPTNTSTVLAVTLGKISTTQTSAHLEWSTNVPTESKLFFSLNGSTQVAASQSGNSTFHMVDLQTLPANTTVSYTIEAIAGQQVQKTSGTFSTSAPVPLVPTSFDIPSSPTNLEQVLGGGCQQIFLNVGVKDQNGNLMPNQSITFTNPETGATETKVTSITENNNRARYYYVPQATNTTQTVKFTSGSISGTFSVKIGKTFYEEDPGSVIKGDSYWYHAHTGIRVDPITGKCL
jgi:hypothetical protein